MLSSLFENITGLTNRANEYVEQNEIEQCYIALIERQNLLEQLCEQVIPENDLNNKKQLTELLLWIQKQDQPNIISLQAKKQETLKMSIKQSQAKKAIKQYKGL